MSKIDNSFSPSEKQKKNKYTIVPNCFIRNNSLSNSAFRLICYLSTNSDTWIVYNNFIMKELGWGRKMLDKAIKDLYEMGFIKMTQVRNQKGRFSHNHYEWDFEPIFLEENQESIKEKKKKKEDSNNFTVVPKTDVGETDNGKGTSTKTNPNKDESTKTNSGSPSLSSPNSYLSEHCHSEAMSFDKNQEKESREGGTPFESPEEGFGKGKKTSVKASPPSESISTKDFLISTKIDMRPDVLDYLSNTNTLEKLQETFLKYQNTVKCMKNVRSHIQVFRSILNGSIGGMKGSVGMNNEEWARKFVKENKIEGLVFRENYIMNSVTEDEISFQIDSHDFKIAINSWFYEE